MCVCVYMLQITLANAATNAANHSASVLSFFHSSNTEAQTKLYVLIYTSLKIIIMI